MSSSVIVTRSIARKMEGETAKNVSADADGGRTHAEQQGCHDRKHRVWSYWLCVMSVLKKVLCTKFMRSIIASHIVFRFPRTFHPSEN